jgi:hypothetical protein
MKQTAIEWLMEQVKIKQDLTHSDVDKAKEMEMIQIIEAFDDGFQNQCDADLYFNKKFKPDYKNE